MDSKGNGPERLRIKQSGINFPRLNLGPHVPVPPPPRRPPLLNRVCAAALILTITGVLVAAGIWAIFGLLSSLPGR